MACHVVRVRDEEAHAGNLSYGEVWQDFQVCPFTESDHRLRLRIESQRLNWTSAKRWARQLCGGGVVLVDNQDVLVAAYKLGGLMAVQELIGPVVYG